MKMYVYVFGPGVGESIVLQYPKESGKGFYWGVIDCHSEEVLRFLQNEKKVDVLDFVCWTHPHEDHHKGMPALLQAYEGKICRFWRFGGYNPKMLLKFSDIYTKNSKHRDQFSRIEQIFDFALKQKKHGANSYRILADLHQGLIDVEYSVDRHFRISSLSPSSQLVEDYTSHLGKCVEQIRLSGDQLNLDWKGLESAHNNISVVLLVSFGETRLLFGSDAEKKSWCHIVASEERQHQQLSLDSHFVKISHHGSENGYHKDAWAEITLHNKPSVAITPFRGSQLPTDKGLILLKKHCSKIYLTATKKNYQSPKINSMSIKLKYKWKANTQNRQWCTFEFDNLGKMTKVSLSDTAVIFSGS